jgi:hypothetical protein
MKKTSSTSTGLTGAPYWSDRCPQRCPKVKKKVNPTFEELLAK